MLYATVDARDGTYQAECNKCCCEPLNVRPGETNLVVLNYATWAIPIGGRGHGMGCTPQIEVEQMQTCPVPSGSNLPPTANDEHISFITPVNTPFNGNLATSITDPESDPITFSLAKLS